MPPTSTKSSSQEVLNTAQFLFKMKGYPATSMRDIARQVDMKAPSLYNHFNSKEEILYTICQRIAEAFFELQENVNRMNGSPEERLREVVKGHVKVITDNLDASGVFIHEWKYMRNDLVSEFIDMRKSYESFIRDLVVEGKQEGHFKDVDEKFTTLMILSSLNWIYNWYNPDGSMTPDEIGGKLNQLLLTGLLKT